MAEAAWEIFGRIGWEGTEQFVAEAERIKQSKAGVDAAMKSPSTASAGPRPASPVTGGGGMPGGMAIIGGRRMDYATAARYGISAGDFISAGGRPPGGGAPPPSAGGGGYTGGFPAIPAKPRETGYTGGFPAIPGKQADAGYTGGFPGFTRSRFDEEGHRINKLGKRIDEFGNELNKSGKEVAKFGLRTAWILRSATAGGPLGMAGGAIGAGIGLAAGNPAFGALLGNMLGQMAQHTVGANDPGMALARPGLAYQRQRAEMDREAANALGYQATYQAGTAIERYKADFLAKGGKTVTGAIGDFFTQVYQGTDLAITKVLARAQGIQVTPGAGAGLAKSPLAGHIFSSADELYKSVAAMTIMQNQPTALERQAQAAGMAGQSLAGKGISRNDLPRLEKQYGPAVRQQPGESFDEWRIRLSQVIELMDRRPAVSGPPGEDHSRLMNGLIRDSLGSTVLT